MKNSITVPRFLNFVIAFFAVFSTWACSFEQATPVIEDHADEERITIRTDMTSLANEVKVKVSERDNIPLNQITSCYYFGMTTQGYYEYRLQTMYHGPKVYFVTGIIGDEAEGF